MRILLALGGNAILKEGESGTYEQQERNINGTARKIADVVRRGNEVIVTYGNGPQIGDILLRNELSSSRLPAMPLHVCGGESQGMIGYMLAQSLSNELRRLGMADDVVCVLTRTVVKSDDPAFGKPSKPIGPFYGKREAERLARRYGWHIAKEAGGYRRVVASPLPISIVEMATLRGLFSNGKVVVCAGGGGVPVVRKGSRLIGVDSVIDKDLTSSLLARQLKVDLFAMLTDVTNVFLNYRKKGERRLDVLYASECSRYIAEGQFGEGTMKPKVEAALEFVSKTGKGAVIASLAQAEAAVLGKAGTRITPDRR